MWQRLKFFRDDFARSVWIRIQCSMKGCEVDAKAKFTSEVRTEACCGSANASRDTMAQ